MIIEALDFDWIFHEDNAKTFLRLLAIKSNHQIMNKKSIKIVIELMWSHYKPSIIKYIFFPYILYLASLSTIASAYCGTLIFLDQANVKTHILMDEEDESIETAKLEGLDQARNYKLFIEAITLSLTSIGITFMILFGSLETNMMVESGWGYFEDPWNWVDFISLSLNFCFFGLSSFDYIF